MNNRLNLAGCILLNDQNEILLLHRNTPKRTQWEIPGGKIEPGESETETVVREIKEELAVDIRVVRQLGSREFTEDGFTMGYTWFLVETVGGQPSIGEPDKFDDLRSFSQAELVTRKAELSANTVNFLEAWQAGDLQLPH
jgi:8-oxo-dGTP diphosphatase